MWLTLALVSFLLAVAVHAAAVRLPVKRDVVLCFVIPALAIGALLVVLLLALYGVSLATAAAALLYAFLCELFIFAFTMVMTSVSVTLLISLRSKPATATELQSLYDPTGMVGRRLERLLRARLVAAVNGGLRLSDRGRLLYSVFIALRAFFGHA